MALGHCYTYDPPKDGLPHFDGGIGLFLGHKEAKDIDLIKYQVFIHGQGQFWPNDNFPLVYRVAVLPSQIHKLYFKTIRYEKVKYENVRPCYTAFCISRIDQVLRL